MARSVWNDGFWPVIGLRNWDSRDHFEQIKELLFKALVIAPLEEGHCCDLCALGERVCHVVPLAAGPVPIAIQRPREGDRNQYWDDATTEITAADAELHFLDYFDWNHMAPADFQYYRVRITAFPAQPHLIGREALLHRQYGRVLVEERHAG
jgi:hypothetical protein